MTPGFSGKQPLDLDILVVDDEESFQFALRELFEEAGCRVVTVGTAEDGVEALQAQRFDVAFVDLRLPRMLGIELITRLRADWPKVEIVVVSAFASLESAIDAIRHDAFDFLLKPIESLDTLLAILHRLRGKLSMEAERKKLLEELQRRNSEIELVSEWGHRIADALSLQDVGRSAVAGLSRLSGGRAAVLCVTDTGGEFRCTAAYPERAPVETCVAADVLAKINGDGPAGEHPEVRASLEEALGESPELIESLALGSNLRGVYALAESSDIGAPVSTEALTQYVTRVETGLSRAIQYKRMSESTYRDGLTGLYNRQYLEERLLDEIARAQRYDRPLSLLFMDIDNFKSINDTLGHRAGDQVILALSDLLQAAPGTPVAGHHNRASDIPARYGGDEFILVLPETDVEGARTKAERLRESMERVPSPDGSKPDAHFTVSIGIATFPRDADSSDALIDAADKALYVAKGAGRNRVVVSGSES